MKNEIIHYLVKNFEEYANKTESGKWLVIK